MSLLGVSSSFTGPAEALQTILEDTAEGHTYAYSGDVLTVGSLAFNEMLSFTTGQNYTVGELVSFGATDIANPSQGAHSLTKILFNGVSIGLIKLESGKEGMQAYGVIPLLIPPNTEVVVSLAAESAGWNSSVSFVGRRYK